MRNHPLGIYEKALAKDLSWPERLVLAKSCGFDFVEMSVDETDERLSRLDWSTAQRTSLDGAYAEIACQTNRFAHDLPCSLAYRVVTATKRKATMCGQAHRRDPNTRFDHRGNQRSPLCGAPVKT